MAHVCSAIHLLVIVIEIKLMFIVMDLKLINCLKSQLFQVSYKYL